MAIRMSFAYVMVHLTKIRRQFDENSFASIVLNNKYKKMMWYRNVWTLTSAENSNEKP